MKNSTSRSQNKELTLTAAKRLKLVIALVACCSPLAFARSSKTAVTFQAVVVDVSGAAIQDAHVFARWNTARRAAPSNSKVKDLSAKTDTFGKFSFALSQGFWDVCVHATGFSAQCHTVSVGSDEPTLSKFILRWNELIGDEYGRHAHELISNPVPTVSSPLAESIPVPY